MTPNRAVARAAARVQRITKRWPVTLCDSVGDITPGFSAAVPGEPGMVYCVMPDGSVMKAYNGRIGAATGKRAWAGYEPHNPNFFRILDFAASYSVPPGGGTAGVGVHHTNHEFPSWDVVYSQARQLMPLRVKAFGGMIVGVEPSPVWTTTGWMLSPSSTLDLAADIPVGGSRYALIYLNADGVLARRLGAVRLVLAGPLTYADIPVAQLGERALAAVMLYAGQTAIVETLVQRDVVDLRFAGAWAGAGPDGWVAAGETWTYVSADGPTGVFSVPADVTTKYQAGQRVKYTQTTPKYGIITAVGAFGAGVTPITIYGGTDYTLANAAITSPLYSIVKAPLGFPMSPAKWTETFTDTSTRTQASPTAGIWYNVGSLQLSIPIGVWNVEYLAQVKSSKSAATQLDAKLTLSTANNSESDIAMSAYFVTGGASGTLILEAKAHMSRLLALAAKTTYYLNMLTGTAGTASIIINGANTTTIIRAVSAYL
jgi:hypothetical protein